VPHQISKGRWETGNEVESSDIVDFFLRHELVFFDFKATKSAKGNISSSSPTSLKPSPFRARQRKSPGRGQSGALRWPLSKAPQELWLVLSEAAVCPDNWEQTVMVPAVLCRKRRGRSHSRLRPG
jgi:hypothetical protein